MQNQYSVKGVCVGGASIISMTTVNRKEDTACFQNALLVHRWLMNQWMMVNDFILFSHLIGRMPNYKATPVHFVVWLDCSWWTSAENKVRRDQTWVSAWSGINASLIHTSLGRWLSSVRRPDWKSCGVMLGWQLSSSSRLTSCDPGLSLPIHASAPAILESLVLQEHRPRATQEGFLPSSWPRSLLQVCVWHIQAAVLGRPLWNGIHPYLPHSGTGCFSTAQYQTDPGKTGGQERRLSGDFMPSSSRSISS